MILVLNEWVFHDLLSENGPDAFRETAAFLVSFIRSGDRMVVPAEKRWREKAFHLMNMSDPRGREVSKRFHSLMRDTRRAIHIKPEDAPSNPQESYARVPPEDVYLVLAYVASGADLLVTTDEGLFQAVAEHDELNCRMRDDFLQWYSSPEGSG
jgi:hypothetical protein